MAIPTAGIGLSGGLGEIGDSVHASNVQEGRDPLSYGVFSAWPFMSPKYAKHRSNRHHEFEDTMARMFIQVPSKVYRDFLNSLADPVTREVARKLTGDDAGTGGVGYIDFFLQNAVHDFNEKVQIVETLSDNYVAFFFGHRAPVFRYQGTLLNTYQDDWAMRMFRIFRDLGRGTQLARRKFLLRIRYDSMIVSGAMMNFNWSLSSDMQIACPFNFDLLVKNVQVYLGGLSSPTDLIHEKHFAPTGFHLESPGQVSKPPAQTSIGCSSASSPGGVSEADYWDISKSQTTVDISKDTWSLPVMQAKEEAALLTEEAVRAALIEERRKAAIRKGEYMGFQGEHALSVGSQELYGPKAGAWHDITGTTYKEPDKLQQKEMLDSNKTR